MTSLKCEQCGASLNIENASGFIVCEFCGVTSALPESQRMNKPEGAVNSVFARWSDGYYYPATIGATYDKHIQALYLDGDVADVQKEHVVELQKALDTFALEGNWKNQGTFYTGKLSGRQPMIMNYDDGDVEQVQLHQLRGKRP
jgi:hypothetical protein